MARSTTLTVWLYDSAMGAAAGEVRLKDLEQRHALVVHDAVTVSWFPGTHEPHVGHLRHHTVRAAARGSLLGALVGAALFAPVAGAAAGAGVAALTRRARGIGIDPAMLEQLKTRLAPGRSAMVVLSSEADPETVMEFVTRGLARGDVELAYTRLPDDAPDEIRRLLAEVHQPADEPSDEQGRP